jgi:hypothetical protein
MSLSERLRPTRLSDLIQPRAVIAPLERMVAERKLMNMMFYGEPCLDVGLNVALGCAQCGMSRQHLHVSQRAAHG